MDVLIVTVFVSLMLVAAGLALFVNRLRDGDFEHADRLSLLPLDDDGQPVSREENAEDVPPDPRRADDTQITEER